MRSTLLGYGLLAPSLFGVVCFLLLPMLVVVWLSLHRWDLLGPIRYVGLDNWRSVLTDPGFGNSLLVTLCVHRDRGARPDCCWDWPRRRCWPGDCPAPACSARCT